MMSIFNFFGSVLGYLLWFLYTVFKNYGIAIILFTIIVKALMFPFSIKSQKSMAAQSRLASKQQELQKKYAKDQMKYNEELQKLYEKEGVNPGGGCLTTLLPFPIMLGIYYSVIYPLSNTLHIAKDTISQATEFVSKIPGIASTNQYVELEIVKNFDALKDHLTMFSADDVQKIEFFGKGFKCFGLDLLASPNTSSFASMLWIIPVLALVTYWGQSFVMQKLQPTQQQGCRSGLHEGHDVRHAAPVRILGIHHAGSCRFLLDYFRAGRFCTDAHHAQVFFAGAGLRKVGSEPLCDAFTGGSEGKAAARKPAKADRR